MNKTAQTIAVISILPAYLFGLATIAYSQSIEQIAYNIVIEDPSAREGMIVKLASGKYDITVKEYDPEIYGVIVKEAAVVFNRSNENTRAVVRSGQAEVLVSKKNGDIKVGDLITSSNDKGIGQKATKSGHILGKALENFPNSEETEETSVIKVLVSPNFNEVSATSESLTDAGLDQVAKKVGGALLSGNIPELIKYLFALLLGSISFFIGLAHFVRSNRTAVESVARNPMAKADIQKQLIIGTAGILFICGIGMAISVWILFFL